MLISAWMQGPLLKCRQSTRSQILEENWLLPSSAVISCHWLLVRCTASSVSSPSMLGCWLASFCSGNHSSLLRNETVYHVQKIRFCSSPLAACSDNLSPPSPTVYPEPCRKECDAGVPLRDSGLRPHLGLSIHHHLFLHVDHLWVSVLTPLHYTSKLHWWGLGIGLTYEHRGTYLEGSLILSPFSLIIGYP